MGLIAAGKVGHGGTYNSIPPACAGAIANLDALQAGDGEVYRTVEHIGGQLMSGIRGIATRLEVPIVVQGYGAIFYVGFPRPGSPLPAGQAVYDYRSSLAMNNELYTAFVSSMVDRGVRIIPRGNWFLSSAHSQADVDATLAAVEAALIEAVIPALHPTVSA